MTQNAQTTSGHTYTFSAYSYSLSGSLKNLTYPSGRTITTNYDDANRVDGLSGQKSGESNKNYASSFSYAAHGAVGSMELGNGLWEHTKM